MRPERGHQVFSLNTVHQESAKRFSQLISFQSSPQPHHRPNQRHHHAHQIPKPPPRHQLPNLLLLPQPLRLRILRHQHMTPTTTTIRSSLRNQRRIDAIHRELRKRHDAYRSQCGKSVDGPIRGVRAVGIIGCEAEAQAGCQGGGRAVRRCRRRRRCAIGGGSAVIGEWKGDLDNKHDTSGKKN